MEGKYIPLPKEEIYLLVRQAQQGDEGAKNRIIETNGGLVRAVAVKFVSPEHELEDLIQIGYIGLLRAVERFDPAYDVMFSTYAVPMIMGEIKRFFRDNGKIKVSRALKEDIFALRRMQSAFELQTGRPPRIGEMAEALETTPERILEIIEAGEQVNGIISLDQQPGETAGKAYSAAGYDERQTDLIVLKDEIRLLKDKERLVVLLRYFRDMTQQQIADRLGISQVQVSRLEKQAIQKIREKMLAE